MKNKSIFHQLFLYSLGVFLVSCGGGDAVNNPFLQSNSYSSIAEIAAVLTIEK